MSAPWTPGPWRVEYGTTLIWGNRDPDDATNNGMGYPVARCEQHHGWHKANRPDADEQEANARLIAAAPEMAEVLKKTERHMVSFYRDSSPSGNVGNENAFADNDAIIIEIRTLLTHIYGGSTMSALLPCPFCGRMEARFFVQQNSDASKSFGIQCGGGECAITGPDRDDHAAAIAIARATPGGERGR